MNRVPIQANPFAIRDAKFVLLVDAIALAGDDGVCKQWIDSLYGGLLPLSRKHAYTLMELVQAKV
ncbi:hypothetical protein QYG89_05945 [Bacillus sp. B190/17]|uniref:Uncharacterized protein n=1 Tax=Bacillus lumedeiriae TaxID=3058829 RepID=A0ABW8I6U8_9BACI